MVEEKPRVYLVYYDDDGDGEMVFVTAKNRKEAKRKSGIVHTNCAWRPDLDWVDGKAVDKFGNIQKEKRK